MQMRRRTSIVIERETSIRIRRETPAVCPVCGTPQAPAGRAAGEETASEIPDQEEKE